MKGQNYKENKSTFYVLSNCSLKSDSIHLEIRVLKSIENELNARHAMATEL